MHKSHEQPKEGKGGDVRPMRYSGVLESYTHTGTYAHTHTHTNAHRRTHTQPQLMSFVCTKEGPAATRIESKHAMMVLMVSNT